ncbi:cupin [Rhodomicrobium udaipurense JA643]|uniref:Cupin domain-containing protein n=1 Tax=Rhodomicrobium udaipurense TaxID=1202716 RepID=A0A8I1KJF9_9HYPH|nr:cupin domain-containing protein [Rhodomicrobium udaipurense]KAI95888.1 cupin [Rhodomicrobium udaipurense JA643]MBJ7542844.1 cupin domain-containing protein [Rhodomicrobium udaipurense]
MKTVQADFRDPTLTADQARAALDLKPHPEGGHYRELWRDAPLDGERGAASAILFLLAAGERSHWHRVDAAEIWIWQAGAPLALGIAHADGRRETLTLGPNAGGGEAFQGVVPAFAWQEAVSLGAWTLVSCIVAPAFRFAGFELASPGWSPDAA